MLYEDIGDIFSNDNVPKLQQHIDENYLYDDKDRIEELTSLACGNGAIKCFKYLILNFDLEKDKNLLSSAIIGGNLDIVRLFIQDGFNLDSEYFEQCIISHQYEIFDWIIQNIDTFPEFNRPSKDGINFLYNNYNTSNACDYCFGENLFNMMIKFEFVHGFKFLKNQIMIKDMECPFIEFHLFRLENKLIDPNSVFWIACKLSMTELARLVIHDYDSIDMNSDRELSRSNSEAGNMTPLILACLNGNLEMIRLILQHDGIDVNKTILRYDCNQCPPFDEERLNARRALNFNSNFIRTEGNKFIDEYITKFSIKSKNSYH